MQTEVLKAQHERRQTTRSLKVQPKHRVKTERSKAQPRKSQDTKSEGTTQTQNYDRKSEGIAQQESVDVMSESTAQAHASKQALESTFMDISTDFDKTPPLTNANETNVYTESKHSVSRKYDTSVNKETLDQTQHPQSKLGVVSDLTNTL